MPRKTEANLVKNVPGIVPGIHPKGMCVRRGHFYYRRHVPQEVQSLIGLIEIWRPLKTDSLKTALRRFHFVASKVDAEIELARRDAGLAFDETIVGPFDDDLPARSAGAVELDLIPEARVTNPQAIEAAPEHAGAGLAVTFGEAYDRYLADPTHSWAARTREAFETSRKMAVAVIGADLPLYAFSRVQCRNYIEVLRFLPRNSAKRFPKLTPQQASERARLSNDGNLISSANANVYLANLSSFLNWAVNEELLPRNPARGLRFPDEVAKRDKRSPFSAEQLKQIFHAPLYQGCRDGERGYAIPGDQRPRNARYWVPLIGLHSGMRLNEICQLDVPDIRLIDGVHCFVITEKTIVGSTDKILKTGASERVIPLHQNLIDLGLVRHAIDQQREGRSKLFDEIDPGTKGIRAVAFSKWFTQFLRKSGAARERTCFHSFRHNFRDELRLARVDHDIAMALGGWANGSAGKGGSAENYGNGFRVQALNEAMSRLRFANFSLSKHAVG